MSLAIRLAAVSFIALVGCGTTNPSDGSGGPANAGTVMLPDLGVVVAPTTAFYTTDELGYRGFMDAFRSKDRVFLDTTGGAVAQAGTQKLQPGHDCYYQVSDVNGAVMSTDDLECRRIHINGLGSIATVYSASDLAGHPCTHTTSLDTNPVGSGGLLVSLMPFRDSTIVSAVFQSTPAMRYTVKLAAAVEFDGDFSNEPGFDFTVLMPAPVCGNGILEQNEACDDGNENDHDGCSHDCTIELCGNGVLDAGEQCDDGNRVSGDGCTNDCLCEPM